MRKSDAGSAYGTTPEALLAVTDSTSIATGQ